MYMAACYTGALLTMPLVSYICDNWGWEASFYVTGVLPILWLVPWLWYMCDKPADHPSMTDQELAIIQRDRKPVSAKKHIVPAKVVLSSARVWASIATVS